MIGPKVEDCVAQTVVRRYLEPLLDRHFDANFDGYRCGMSTKDAVAVTQKGADG